MASYNKAMTKYINKNIAIVLILFCHFSFAEVKDAEALSRMAENYSESPPSPDIAEPGYTGNKFHVFHSFQKNIQKRSFINPRHKNFMYRNFPQFAPELLPLMEILHFNYEALLIEYKKWKDHPDFEEFGLYYGKPGRLTAPQDLNLLLLIHQILAYDLFFISSNHKSILNSFYMGHIQTESFLFWTISEQHIRALSVLNIDGSRSGNLLELTTKNLTDKINVVISKFSSLMDSLILARSEKNNLLDWEKYSLVHEKISEIITETGNLKFELEILKRLLEPAVKYSSKISGEKTNLKSVKESEAELRKIAKALATAFKDSVSLEEERNNNSFSSKSKDYPEVINFPTDIHKLIPLVMEDSVHTLRLFSGLHFDAPRSLTGSESGRRQLFQMVRDGLFQQSLLAAGAVISKTLEQEHYGRGTLGRFSKYIFGKKPLSLSSRSTQENAQAVITHQNSGSTGTAISLQSAKTPQMSKRSKKLSDLEDRLWKVFFEEFQAETNNTVFDSSLAISNQKQNSNTPQAALSSLTCEKFLSNNF